MENFSIDGPDFVGIGFQRCATSWLNFMLFEHPEICKPKSGLHYFNNNYDKGKDWYLNSILHACSSKTNIRKYGEFSTTYSYPEHHSKVIARLSKNFPDVKILINIRNPIERVNSEYYRLVKRNDIDRVGLMKAINIYPEIVERGFYSKTIKDYKNSFGENNVLVTLYDDILDNPIQTLALIYSFIGVDSSYIPSDANIKFGVTNDAKSKNVDIFINKISRIGVKVFNTPCFNLWKSPAKLLIRFLRESNSKKKNISNKDKNYFKKIYIDDIQQVQKIINRDLSVWLK